MSLVRRITTNAGIILIGTLLQRAVQLVLVIYVARHVPVEVFGQYNLALAVLFIAAFFIDMGISPATVREIARDRSRAEHRFSHILALRITLSVLLYGAVAAFAALSGYADSTKTLILLLGLSLFPNAVAGACETLNIAFENMKLSVTVRFIGMVAGAVGSFSAMELGYGLQGFIVANLLAEVATAIFWAFCVRSKYFQYRIAFDFGEWRKIMSHATPFALMLFLQQLNRTLNVILLSKVPGPIPAQTAIGYYSSAAQIARVATPLLVSVRQALIPSLAAGTYDAETHANLLKWTTKGIFMLVSLPLILAGVFFSRDLITLMFGAAYEAAAPAFTILCTAFALEAAMIGFNGFLSASRDISRFVKYAVVSVAISTIAAIALIPHFGVNGAAFGALLSKVFEILCAIFLCRSIWGKGIFMIRHYLDIALLGLSIGGAIFLVRWACPGFFLSAAISAILYLSAAGLLVTRIRRQLQSVRDREQTAAKTGLGAIQTAVQGT